MSVSLLRLERFDVRLSVSCGMAKMARTGTHAVQIELVVIHIEDCIPVLVLIAEEQRGWKLHGSTSV